MKTGEMMPSEFRTNFDDKTLQGLTAALNSKLEINPKALEMIKKNTKSTPKQYAKARQLGTI